MARDNFLDVRLNVNGEEKVLSMLTQKNMERVSDFMFKLAGEEDTNKLCYNCGNPLVAMDDRYQCIEAGCGAFELIDKEGEKAIKDRLEYLRGEIRAERISTSEILELQELSSHIDESDVELLEWAGVKEKHNG